MASPGIASRSPLAFDGSNPAPTSTEPAGSLPSHTSGRSPPEVNSSFYFSGSGLDLSFEKLQANNPFGLARPAATGNPSAPVPRPTAGPPLSTRANTGAAPVRTRGCLQSAKGR